ncbi:MAG: single-stranded DNA-binding protein [Nanoarchaeota archaeon]|nr:single-stranded DNA-binding protein [Nanoarchaeota archaeon]
MNKTIVSGHLGGDAEKKTTKAGKDYLSFSMANTRGENTTWFNCSIFNEKTVIALQKYLRKGTKVLLVGYYNPTIWQTREGEHRLDHSLMVNEVELMGSRVPEAAPEPSAAPAPGKNTDIPSSADTAAGDKDDLPF